MIDSITICSKNIKDSCDNHNIGELYWTSLFGLCKEWSWFWIEFTIQFFFGGVKGGNLESHKIDLLTVNCPKR